MDLNGDGIPDIASGSYHPGAVYWFEGTGDGYRERREIPEEPSNFERHATTATFYDWDGDGDLDMLVGNIAGEVGWAENRGTPKEFRFGPRTALRLPGRSFEAPGGDSQPYPVDWDADGILDLLVGCGDGSVMFFPGEGRSNGRIPAFTTARILLPAGTLGVRVKVFPHDWNEDGHLDLLVGDRDRPEGGFLYVFLRKP